MLPQILARNLMVAVPVLVAMAAFTVIALLVLAQIVHPQRSRWHLAAYLVMAALIFVVMATAGWEFATAQTQHAVELVTIRGPA